MQRDVNFTAYFSKLQFQMTDNSVFFTKFAENYLRNKVPYI